MSGETQYQEQTLNIFQLKLSTWSANLLWKLAYNKEIHHLAEQDSQKCPLGDWSSHTVNAYGLLSLQQLAPALERGSRLVERHPDISTNCVEYIRGE